MQEDRRGKNRTRKTETFTPLNVPKEDLVSVLKEKYGVPDPEPMHPRSQNFWDKTKYCLFHRDHGHLTEHCIQLKQAIEKLIQEGRLGEYKAQGAVKEPERGKERVIEVITTEVPSLTQLKRQIHSLKTTFTVPEYFDNKETITFSRSELAPTSDVQLNPLVIKATLQLSGIDKCLVKRLLVDTGASKNVLPLIANFPSFLVVCRAPWRSPCLGH